MNSKTFHFLSALLLASLATPAFAELSIKAAGADAEVSENVRAHLSLADEPCDAPDWRVRREFKAIDKEIQPALRALGYYGATVKKSFRKGEKCWEAEVELALGEPVKVRSLVLSFTGDAANDPAFAALRDKLPLKVGDVLHHGRYEQVKTALRNLALERGYFDAGLSKHELRVDPKALAADITLVFDGGDRYRFGQLHFSEQPLDVEFVRRLANMEGGGWYDARKLIELDRNLSDGGYFGQVDVRPLHDKAVDHAVPVDVRLQALPRHVWRAGVGFATDTGPRLTLGYANRRVTSDGHRFESELRLSPVETGLTANYLIPGADPHRETYSFDLGLVHEETDAAISDSAQAGARWVIKRDDWTETRYLELLHEESDIGGQLTTATLLMPGIGWTLMKADDPLHTRRGLRLNLDVRGAYEGALSTASLLQVRAGAKAIYRFGDAGRVTARTEFGTTLGGDFFNLPASLRFFAGGDNSVRGYAYKSLSPEDADGDPVGGRHLITGGIEYEHPVVGEDWWAAIFADGGNAYDTDDFEMKYGYGVGARWYSPFGRLKVDLAFPSDTSQDSWRLHFSFGADL